MNLSESFYSIQGEGVTQGVPAYFIRLSGCNMICGGTRGALVKSGHATWWCDSEPVWRQGTEVSNNQVLKRVMNDGKRAGIDILEGILDGTIHVVWTGGEPTMPRNRQAITEFVDLLERRYPRNRSFHELETNGTIFCPDGFYGRIDQINCSPKLENSGMKPTPRIVPEALRQISGHRNSWFKFVVSSENDLHEIEADFLGPFGIDKTKVILMPAVDNLDDLPGATRSLYDLCKRYGYRGVTRSHILAWDQTTGV